MRTQISLICEGGFKLRRPLAPIMHGAHKVLTEGSYENPVNRPLWAVIVWRLRRLIPRFLWD